jgi:hypothetical protein
MIGYIIVGLLDHRFVVVEVVQRERMDVDLIDGDGKGVGLEQSQSQLQARDGVQVVVLIAHCEQRLHTCQ